VFEAMAGPATEFEDATIVVELTPAGRGAVAVVLIDGSESISAVERYFVANGKRPLGSTPLQRIVVGRWGSSAGEELVVARRSEHQIEVHCHGGVAAVRKIVVDLVAAGCQEIPWRDWLASPRSRLNCSPKLPVDDAITRAAQIALTKAITLPTAAVLLDQLNGALSTAIHTGIDLISRGEWERAGKLIDDVLSHCEFGLHLTTPWRVVLAGPPNVGKSSLINALAGFQRAIVSPTPGTTRDVVTLTTAIDGWPVELADTAGLRSTTDEIESAGVRLAEEMLTAADVVLLVHDASQSASLDSRDENVARCSSLTEHRCVIDVWNKIDLPPNSIAQRTLAIEKGHSAVPARVRTSAITGAGINDLIRAISRALVPNVPPPGAPIPFTALQIESLVVAGNAIKRRQAVPAQEALQSLLAFS
jgi:tRNA modification GTPase